MSVSSVRAVSVDVEGILRDLGDVNDDVACDSALYLRNISLRCRRRHVIDLLGITVANVNAGVQHVKFRSISVR